MNWFNPPFTLTLQMP